MKIGMVQFRPAENMKKTMAKVEDRITEAKEQGVRILCFPEMSLSGYTLSPDEINLQEQKEYLERIRELAIQADMTVLIGGAEKEGEKYFISQFVINDKIRSYRKMHPGEKESQVFGAGTKPGLFETDGLRFGIMLCYDSRFPELAQMLALMGAEIIFIPTASPNEIDKRVGMWKKYLVARAYDNRLNVVATNLLFNNKGGGVIGYDKSGDILFEHIEDGETLLVFEPDHRLFDNSSMMRRDFLFEKRKRFASGAGLVGIDDLWFGGLSRE